ncbi:MAG: glycoside hydrolase family 15 protein [Planctomycetota bacterium]|jgi:GH15 family glucan-1,4-alpha-glucosidase
MLLDHGIIGNGRVLALVHPDSSVDWCCMPRFDSPSLFARILDEENGGTWQFLSDGELRQGELNYVRNTNVLRHVFHSESGSWELFDFMPRIPDGLRHRTPLSHVRLLRPLTGRPRISVNFDPRPDYGRIIPDKHMDGQGLSFEANGQRWSLQTNLPIDYVLSGQEFTLDAPRFFKLDYGLPEDLQHIDDIHRSLDLTIAGWRKWASDTSIPGFADAAVIRSALCLKLHAYEPTGAIIAAATTSLPEMVGEPRTWDYRYCWLRDSVFTVEALRRLAHFWEGRQFLRFLLDVVESGPLQPLYGIGGERDLPESELEHLSGFEGTKPVRVGNAAASQYQADLMGEVVLCIRSMLIDQRSDLRDPSQWYPLVARIIEESIEGFDREDMGIWEYRGKPMLHTFSRAMCWAAVHNGADIAEYFGHQEQADAWRIVADAMRKRLLEESYCEEEGMFLQAVGCPHADAALLLLPSIGFLPATDPRFLSTLDRYKELLVRDGGVMRYVHEDDFGTPTTSTFTICSFWYIEALALAGRLEEAVEMFESISSKSNDLGLFSEDYCVEDQRMLGNFPQAYTHVGLINAAMTLGNLLRARDGNFHAWS